MYESINFVAINFETATSKAACQIGIAVVRQGEIVEEVCRYIQPPANRYARQTIAVHHITPDMTKDAPTFAELWPELRKYFHCQLIVAHNASFDMGILSKEMERYNLQDFRPMGIVCTYELTGYKLKEACASYGIEIENHHNALADAKACAQLFIAYLTREPDAHYLPTYEEPKPTFAPFTLSSYAGHTKIDSDLLVQDLSNADPNNMFYNKKVVITGIFPLDRNELARKLKSMGADINTAVSRKTDFILVGEEPGPAKIQKCSDLIAEGYPIKPLHWDDFKKEIK